MTTELATVQGTGLTLEPGQDWWNDRQKKGLEQLGLANASQGDLLVFMHVAQRTGLDPFAKQIYMIGRNGREKINGQWVDVVKQTIQTGIDGFRLVARRAADRTGEDLEYEDTEWCGSDGVWRDVWTHGTAPAAARVTVIRNGRRFPAVALYREYVQTKSGGEPNSMWSKMPANQLAKCAEALALRKAYPQDLSGLYTDEEMGQADRPDTARDRPSIGLSARERLATALGSDRTAVVQPESTRTDEGEPVVGELVEDPATGGSPLLDMASPLAKKMFAVLNEVGIPDKGQHEFLSKVLGRTIVSRKDLTEADAAYVVAEVEAVIANPDGTQGVKGAASGATDGEG